MDLISGRTTNGLMLEAQAISKSFQVGGGRRGARVRALREVDLRVAPGRILGLAGESGSGKSTLARLIAGISRPDGGRLVLDGRDVLGEKLLDTSWFKRRVQMVFQDPTSSLNPRRTVGQTVEVSLITLGMPPRQRAARVRELLGLVELNAQLAHAFPGSLSGGQKQRVAIARALALEPRLIVLDEPTSALDVSVQAKIIGLLMRLREQLGLTYLFISHDLSLMRNVADDTAVMYLGKIVERAPTAELFARPRHPYTQMLLSAIPVVSDAEASLKPRRIHAVGEIPSPTHIPRGCPFHPRCPFATPACLAAEPPSLPVGPAHEARCIRADEIADLSA